MGWFYLVKNISFLKNKIQLNTYYKKKKFFFLNSLFLFNFFFKRFVKFKLYSFFTGSILSPKSLIKTNQPNWTFILNKKKQNYSLTLYKQDVLLVTLTLGALVSYYNAGKKSIKKARKGFLLYITTFKKIFNRLSVVNSYKNIFINFFDNNLLIFFKKLAFAYNSTSKLFFNLNLDTTLKSFKKNKCIKRRVLKRKLLVAKRDRVV